MSIFNAKSPFQFSDKVLRKQKEIMEDVLEKQRLASFFVKGTITESIKSAQKQDDIIDIEYEVVDPRNMSPWEKPALVERMN